MTAPRPPAAGPSRRAKFGGALSDDPPNGGAPPPHQHPHQQQRPGPRRDKGKQRAGAAPTVTPAAPAGPLLPPGLAVAKKNAVAVHSDGAGNTADDGICFICADTAIYWAVGECGHRTCHICSIRLRALFKKTECTFCKTECPRVIFTASPSRQFSSFTAAETPFSDSKLGLSFETREQMDDSLALLRFNCPSPTCDALLLGWTDLKRHVKSEHKHSLCELCTQFKKIFAHEHTMYSSLELSAHMPDEHALCGFCRTWFYDSDLLYAHCRTNHEECFICVKQGIKHQYHLNYNKLEEHYKSAHYLCPHPTCLEQKFVVFETELDLQAHAVATHDSALAGDQRARAQARRIETNFTYEETVPPRRGGPQAGPSGRGGRGGGRGGGGGGGGRVTIEPPPQATFVTTQPVMVNGRRAVPGMGPPRGGQQEQQQRGAGGREEPPHRRSEPPSDESRSGTPSRAGTPVGAQPQRAGPPVSSELVERHAALMRRVIDAVSSDTKVTSFKAVVRGYRGSELSAADLVDTLWNMLDNEPDVAGPIITGLADLFDGEKRSQLLSAWQDLRVEANQFPSLAPLGPTLHGLPTSSHAAPRAFHNPHGQRDPAIWARVEDAAASSSSSSNGRPAPRFPPLPVVGLTPRPSSGQRTTPWASSGPGSAAPVPAPVPVRRLEPTSVPGVGGAGARTIVRPAEFPSLPSGGLEAERRARMKAAVAGRPQPGPTTGGAEGWGAGAGAGGAGGEVGVGGGGKKKKKVLLMTHGIQRG